MRTTEERAAVGVNFTEQAPFESLQDVFENVPVLFVDQVTVPVGTELTPWTVALQVTFEPTTTDAWLHVKVTAAPGRLLTVSETGDETTTVPVASFTWSSKDQVPAIVNGLVDTNGLEEGVQPVVKELSRLLKLVLAGGSSSHWQV